jgi:hypothetical protein
VFVKKIPGGFVGGVRGARGGPQPSL